jgi:hypothetical protein
MKLALWIPVVVLCVSTMLDAQRASGIPVVNADSPTIIAFFPNAQKIGSDDADGNEALSDFDYYAERVKEPLNKRGIQFIEEFDRSFRIRSGSETVLFTPKADTPGYYLVQSGRKPRIEYGVTTDVDLLALAKQYFDSHHSAGISIKVLLNSVLPEIRAKSRVAVLAPGELPKSFSEVKYASVQKASDSEYAISLNYKLGGGDAGFAALFAAKANSGYEPQELPNVRKLKLSHGLLGYFRAVSCGGSCAPANLWWKEGRVLYQIQLNLPSSLPEGDQEDTLIAAANSAILAGPR